jgi:predicted RecB family nuclease
VLQLGPERPVHHGEAPEQFTRKEGMSVFLLDSEVPGREQDLVYSASDLVIAATCEYQLLRKLDEKLGRSPKAEFASDPMLERSARLGDLHEHKVLDKFVDDFGPWDPLNGSGVYNVAAAPDMDRATLLAKHQESIDALRGGADVVFQAAFFDGQFHGRSDFLVKQSDGRYAVFDTKLARHAKVTALLQLASYGDQLLRAGFDPHPQMTLILGATVATPDGSYENVRSNHKLADILPVFRERRSRFLELVFGHRSQPEPVSWGSPGITACGRCDFCQEQVRATDDLLLVARMSSGQRKKLHEQGIFTVHELAEANLSEPNPPLLRLQDQARIQSAYGPVDGSVHYVKDGQHHELSYRVVPENTLAELPPPDDGDIFFDFEGDPLWQEDATGTWGLEYLFGVVEAPVEPSREGIFRPFWAHTRAAEKQAFLDFLDYVEERRARYPGMHVYHYAAYEKTALRKLSVIHVAGEDIVDQWLRDGLLVDLYQTVRNSLRISENSYSIKKLEPLYMGTNLRTGEVTDAGASLVAYADFCEARDAGLDKVAADILAGISDYNQYDCVSTLELRNWLLGLASERGIEPGRGPIPGPANARESNIPVATVASTPGQASELRASELVLPSFLDDWAMSRAEAAK